MPCGDDKFVVVDASTNVASCQSCGLFNIAKMMSSECDFQWWMLSFVVAVLFLVIVTIKCILWSVRKLNARSSPTPTSNERTSLLDKSQSIQGV